MTNEQLEALAWVGSDAPLFNSEAREPGG